MQTKEQKVRRMIEKVAGYDMLEGRGEKIMCVDTFTKFCSELVELAIAEEREAGGWQPIETAPKDETPIDLWRRTATWPSGERLPNMRRVYDGMGGVFYEPVFAGPCVVRDASHWMPLPAAPKDEVGA